MTTTDYQPLIVERHDRLVILTFNRPEKLNAFDTRLTKMMYDALAEVDRDETVGSILIRGNGRSFSAGADIKE